MSPRKRAIVAYLVQNISNEVADALRDNLDRSTGARGGASVQLEPLHIWDMIPMQADRTNADKPLVDTGNLMRSIKVDTPTVTSLGGGGVRVTVNILSRDYGLEQARGGTFRNVLLGRTKDLRRMRTFAEAIEGEDYVVVKNLRVPSRPWNDIPNARVDTIVNNAVRRITGA